MSLSPGKTSLCYTNTIFAKLLKYHESRSHCIEEGGYKLFISILEDKKNKHLFLETLDSIKLFLTKREYLSKFKRIPECIQLDPDCADLNVSFLQVLAILSFERENHQALKKPEFLEKLQANDMFSKIFQQFEDMIEDKKKVKTDHGSMSKHSLAIDAHPSKSRGSGVDSQGTEKLKKLKKRKTEQTRQVELALAISIILSNLSNEEDYIKTLLGIQHWPKRLI